MLNNFRLLRFRSFSRRRKREQKLQRVSTIVSTNTEDIRKNIALRTHNEISRDISEQHFAGIATAL